MAQPPEIIWIGCHPGNYAKGRGGFKPIAVVSHVAEGTLAAVDQHFNTARPGNPSSTHFCIGKAGQLHQYVAVADTAWGNGRVNKPNVAAVPWMANPGTSPNRLTISVEWEGAHRRVGGRIVEWWQPVEPQYQAALALYRYLTERYDIAIDRAHIIRHSDINSVEKEFCPGRNFDLARLLGDLGDPAFAKAATPPVVAQDGFTIKGPSTVSLPVFTQFLAKRNSPLLAEGPAADFYEAIDDAGLNVGYCISQWWHESRCGLEDIAAQTKNVANLRPKKSGGIGRAVDVLPTGSGLFRRYLHWYDGVLDYRDLLLDVYADMSIPDAIAKFAPASDNNAPAAYTKAVLLLMSQLSEASTRGANQ